MAATKLVSIEYLITDSLFSLNVEPDCNGLLASDVTKISSFPVFVEKLVILFPSTSTASCWVIPDKLLFTHSVNSLPSS